MFTHNASVNKTAGMSPYELVFRQQAGRPETFFLPKNLASSDEEWTPEKVQKGAVANQVRSDTKKIRRCVPIAKTQDFSGTGQTNEGHKILDETSIQDRGGSSNAAYSNRTEQNGWKENCGFEE